jgi:hypothetical protein
MMVAMAVPAFNGCVPDDATMSWFGKAKKSSGIVWSTAFQL